MTRWDVTEDDVRSNPDRSCFYCGIPVGEKHKLDCVIPTSTWRVRMTIEFDWDAPVSWDTDEVEFQLNRSSWCAGNVLSHLQKLADMAGCLCVLRPTFVAVEDGRGKRL